MRRGALQAAQQEDAPVLKPFGLFTGELHRLQARVSPVNFTEYPRFLLPINSALRVPAQAYLAWAFERLGTHRDVFDLPLEDLTPAAFKKTLG